MLTLKQMIEAADQKSLTVFEDMMSGGAMSPDMPVEAPEVPGRCANQGRIPFGRDCGVRR